MDIISTRSMTGEECSASTMRASTKKYCSSGQTSSLCRKMPFSHPGLVCKRSCSSPSPETEKRLSFCKEYTETIIHGKHKWRPAGPKSCRILRIHALPGRIPCDSFPRPVQHVRFIRSRENGPVWPCRVSRGCSVPANRQATLQDLCALVKKIPEACAQDLSVHS